MIESWYMEKRGAYPSNVNVWVKLTGEEITELWYFTNRRKSNLCGRFTRVRRVNV